MDTQRSFPDINQFGILIAMIMLAYAVTPFVDFAEQNWKFDLFGTVFPFEIDFRFLVSLIVAAMAATGMDWLLRGHPGYSDKNLLQHQLVPAITAWVIGLPLGTIPMGLEWWAAFGFGSFLLVLVFIAEYIVTDRTDVLNPLASLGLTAISFALFLFLAISSRGAELRLFLLFPLITVSSGLISMRTLNLRLSGKSNYFHWAVVVGLLVGQIAVGLQYLPVSPVSYGLILMAPAYSLTILASAFEEDSESKFWVEPAVVLSLLLLMAFIFRNG